MTLDLLRSSRFHAVAVESDFPDADRVNRYVRGSSSCDPSVHDERDALSGFEARFPKFMWRNEQVLRLVRGMKEMNTLRLDPSQRAWFAGMDVYALSRAADAVVSLLVKSGELEAAQRARQRYACFDRFGDEASDYAKGVARGDPGCEGAAVSQLVEMLRREAVRAEEAAARGAAAAAVVAAATEGETGTLAAATAAAANEDALAALCNARSVVNAESYYREMVLGRRNTWNLRDAAMVETILMLKAHLEGGVFNVSDEEEEGGGGGRGAAAPSSTSSQKTKRIIVWAHNSHLGDARATAMSRRGEHNVGQLLRQHFERRGRPGALVSLGFSTFSGTVCAAARWGGQALCRGIRPGIRGSYEEVLHRVSRLLQRFEGSSSGAGGDASGEKEKEQQMLSAVAAAISSSSPGAFLLDLRRSSSPSPSSSSSSSPSPSANSAMIDALSTPRLERAIGVLYVPRSERYSHYFAAKLPEQFDLLVHVDETSAVSPLDFEEEAAPTLERWRERVIGPDDLVENEE